jgi:hypothetical protein
MLTAAGTAVHASCFSSSRIRVTSTTGAEIFVLYLACRALFSASFLRRACLLGIGYGTYISANNTMYPIHYYGSGTETFVK